MNVEREIAPMWSINHCRIQNGMLQPRWMYREYYSCGVDSIIDLLDYTICANISETDVANKSELLRLIYECHKMRENERQIFNKSRAHITNRTAAQRMIQHRLKISMQNDVVWNWLCEYDTANWCRPRKGSIDAELHGVPMCLIDTEFDKQLLGMSLLWKCQNEQCGFEVKQHLFPVSLQNSSSIKNGIEETFHSSCPCGTDQSFTIKDIGNYVLFDLSIVDQNVSLFKLEETLTITGIDRMELVGAIKHTGNHYMSIVKIQSKWYVLNDMQDEVVVGESLEICLNLLDEDQNGKMRGVFWLLYQKLFDREVHIGDESDELENEEQQHTPLSSLNPLITAPMNMTASQKAKERKRRRHAEYRDAKKRIIIEETSFDSDDMIVTSESEQRDQKRQLRNRRYYEKKKTLLVAQSIEREREMHILQQRKTIERKHARQNNKRKMRNKRYYRKRKNSSSANDIIYQKEKETECKKRLRERVALQSTDCNAKFHSLKYCESCMIIMFDQTANKLFKRNKMSIKLNINENDNLCTKCKKSIESNEMPKLCKENNLYLVTIPTSLKNLNFLERRFVCRIQTYMTLLVLPGGQKSQKGMAVYFENEPQELLKILPRTADDVGVVCVSGNYQGYIRPHLIKEALRWLKLNNRLYKDIEIDTDTLTDLAEAANGEDLTHELHNITQSGIVDIDLTLPNMSIRDVLSGKPNKIHFPRSQGPPIMFSGRSNAEALAFPWLFPDGTGSYDEEQKRTCDIKLLKYLHSRLLNKDNRFRCDTPYLMTAVNRYEAERVRYLCNFYMRIQKPTSNNTNSPTTVADLRSIMDNSNNGSSADDNWLMYMRSVRGTSSYWIDQLYDLLARMKVLGPPDIFLTLSVADMHWEEVELLLKEDLGDEYKNISDAVQRDPIIVALYADKRFREMLNWIKTSKVLGEVSDYYCRAEFQNRGTVHYHVFLWIPKCPGLHKENNNNRDTIKNYIDSIISTELPSDDHEEFRRLVEERQMHHHTKTCEDKHGKCRFNFPRRACSETRILYDFETRAANTKSNFYETKRSPYSLNLNPYNPAIFKRWKANMDIQMVHGERGLAYYICKYVAKAEPENFRKELRQLTDELDAMNGLSKKARMYKLGMFVLKRRKMSAQEAAFRITGLKMVHSSRAVQTVSTLTPNKRMRRVLPEEELIGQPDSSTNVFYDSPIESYRKRPLTKDFEKLSLFEFTSWYEKVSTKQHSHQCVPLIDNSAYLRKRLKEKIVRSSKVRMGSDEYYYSLLLLHLPHRTEDELCVGYDCYKEAFLAKEKQLSTLNLPNERLVNEILEATKRLRITDQIQRQLREINRDSDDDEDEEGQIMELDVMKQGLDPMMHKSTTCHTHVPGTTEYDNSERRATHSLLATTWSEEQLLENIEKLTKTQLQTLTYIQHCILRKQQILLFIMGNAGTGKSFLMTVIIEWLRVTQATIVGEDPVIVGAPTGLAAKNINGRTLHNLFRLPLQDGQAALSPKLNEVSIRKFQSEMKGKKFFICDEFSMVGEQTFRTIHERLDQLAALNSNYKNTDLFGGFHVILCGDFYQLRPVRDKFAFQCAELFDLFEIVWLEQNMRQKKDKKWCDLLDRLRVSQLTEEDEKVLRERCRKKSDSDGLKVEMRLYPTIKMVDEYNDSRQSAMTNSRILKCTDIYSTLDTYAPGCTVTAKDLPKDKRNAGGLSNKLEVSIGSRIMLTRNLSATLCNGDQGYVTAFETNEKNITTGILVQFDDENAGNELKDPDFNNHVKINRIDSSFMYKGRNIVREQFPIMPSWAVTIHKAQGMSLASAVVNISKKIFQPGMSYVALSRVRELSGIFIEDEIDFNKVTTNKIVLDETRKWLEKWNLLKKKFKNMKKK